VKKLLLPDDIYGVDNSMDNIILLGESGVGKSTILNYLAGVELKGVKINSKVQI
jgi:putative ribosome biogenesis GTPase RsgA